MSQAHFQIEAGTNVVINNVFIDEAGVEQTLNVNFVDALKMIQDGAIDIEQK